MTAGQPSSPSVASNGAGAAAASSPNANGGGASSGPTTPNGSARSMSSPGPGIHIGPNGEQFNAHSPTRAKTQSIVDALSIPLPDEAELNRQFEEFMEEKQIKPEAREKMRQLPAPQKWKTICVDRFAAGLQASPTPGGATRDNTPEYWANTLKAAIGVNGKQVTGPQMQSLSIVMRGAGKSWLTSFVELDGITSLIDLLIQFDPLPSEGARTGMLHSLKAFMNAEYGLNVIVAHPTAVERITLALLGSSDSQRVLVVDLLSVIVWISEKGHEAVLTRGLTHERFGSNKRFKILVEMLTAPLSSMFHPPSLTSSPSVSRLSMAVREVVSPSKPSKDKDKTENTQSLALQTRTLTFINALINAIPTLEDRVGLRQELISKGMLDAVKGLQDYIEEHRNMEKYDATSEQLQTQLDLFNDCHTQDIQETKYHELDTSDIDAVYAFLKSTTVQQGHSAAFFDVMQSMLLIPSDPELGAKTWLNMKYMAVKVTVAEDEKGRPTNEVPTDMTYEKLKLLLKEKERADAEYKESDYAALQKRVEEQRKTILEWSQKHEGTKEETQALIEKERAGLQEKYAACEKDLAACKAQLVVAQAEIAALKAGGAVPGVPGAPAAPGAPGAPDAPPMAPPMAPGAPGAPDAPPMAPPMNGAPEAPPMAPPMAPGAPGAPDAPPMAPGAPGPPGPPGRQLKRRVL